MFTLIALGVGAAYGYSTFAVLFPGIFPEDLKMEGGSTCILKYRRDHGFSCAGPVTGGPRPQSNRAGD